jgi:flavin-dependent dehydrogenase
MAPVNNISAADFAAKKFDYVIVGGGTAGLVMAARLTENPNISVGVIEAGIDRSDDIIVRAPLLHLELYEKPEYDWLYKTTPQVCLLSFYKISNLQVYRARMDKCMRGRAEKCSVDLVLSTSACLQSHPKVVSTIGLPSGIQAGIGRACCLITGSS